MEGCGCHKDQTNATDLSLLFADLDHLARSEVGHEGEKEVSHAQGDSMGTKIDDDVQVQVQPLVGTIQISSTQVPTKDRWPQNLQVYARRQPQVQGEQQGSDVSPSDTVGQQSHV